MNDKVVVNLALISNYFTTLWTIILQNTLNISCNNEELLNKWFKHFSVNSEITVNLSLMNYKCSIFLMMVIIQCYQYLAD